MQLNVMELVVTFENSWKILSFSINFITPHKTLYTWMETLASKVFFW